MKYALNLSEDGRVLSVTYAEYASTEAIKIEKLPEGNVADYRYVNGEYVYDPLPIEEVLDVPTQLDRIEAQVAYTAMMTDTLLEV